MIKEGPSIFKSVLRSFLKAIFVVFGLGIGFALVMFLFETVGSSKAPQYNVHTKEVYLPNANGVLPTSDFGMKTPVVRDKQIFLRFLAVLRELKLRIFHTDFQLLGV